MNKNILIGLETKVAEALDELISLFDMNTMRWLAKLYDPETGALYYSNSGRDYEGFGPDLESTVQGFRCVANRGMLDDFGGSLKAALPEYMQKRLLDFTKSCADPDGYYYHPQWGKNINIQRRGRDLDWATQIYSWFDEKPPYPLATEQLANAEKRSANTALPEFLMSKKAFYDYLDSLDFAHRSYAAANTLNAQSKQIEAAGLMSACVDWLVAHQNPKNGLWEEDITYSSVSGLMKVSGMFRAAGRSVSCFKRAIDSSLEAALSDEFADAVVYVYNPHSAVASLTSAMEHVGDLDAVAYSKNKYMDKIIPLINRTREKLSVFRKPDGSFSYMPDRCACKSQGAPVALYMENEGDVNATSIAMGGGVGILLHNLDIPFKLYDRKDFEEFLEVLESRTPAVKKPVPEGRESSPGRF